MGFANSNYLGLVMASGLVLQDFFRSDQIATGSNHPSAIAILERVCFPFTRDNEQFVVVERWSIEFAKQVLNSSQTTELPLSFR